MTIDERLEKLAERTEALTQSMELLTSMHLDNEKRFAAAEGRHEERFATITNNFEVVLDSIKSLERIAGAHEARISHLEGD